MNVDSELVTRAQAGDPAALEELVSSVQADVWRLLLSRLGPGADTEDAFQETFRQAIESLGRLRNPRAFPAWLFRIALNKSRSFRNPPGTDAARASTFTEEAAMAIEREETRAEVRKAVAGLEADLRTTVELRYEHGLAYAEIAEAMDVPEGTVSWRLNRAHERLKQVLAGVGVAVTLAVLEGELAAAPAVTVPGAAAARVGGLVREAARPGLGGREKARARAHGRTVAMTVCGLLAGLVSWWAWRAIEGSSAPKTSDRTMSASTAGPGMAPAGRADPANGTGGAKQPEGSIAAKTVAAKARVTGRVTNQETKKAVAGARVILVRLGTPEETVGVCVAGDDGSFALEAVAGEYALNTVAPGYVSARLDNFFRTLWAMTSQDGEEPVPSRDEVNVSLTPDGSAVRDLELCPGLSIEGKVEDVRGFPVEGVNVTADRLARSEGVRNLSIALGMFEPIVAQTDARGEFVLTGVPPRGTLILSAERQGFRPLVQKQVALPPTGPRLTLVLEAGASFRATVRDALGRPLPGVRFFSLQGDPGEFVERPLPGVSDEMGVFSESHGAVLDGIVLAWIEGHGPALIPFNIADASPCDLRLPPATDRIDGRVLDAHGIPQSGLTVVVAELGVASGTLEATFSLKSPGPRLVDNSHPVVYLDVAGPVATTAEDGTFALDGLCLSAGCRVVLAVIHDGMILHFESVDSPGRRDLTLPPE